LRAIYSNRQMEEQLDGLLVLTTLMYLSTRGPTGTWWTDYERDAIRPHVLGKFRDLLEATAKKSRDALLSG